MNQNPTSRTFFVFILIVFATNAFAQPKIGEARMIANMISLKECNFEGSPAVDTSFEAIPNTSKFNIVNQTQTDYIISFWKWSDQSKKETDKIAAKKDKGILVETSIDKNNRLVSSTVGNRRYFLYPKSLIEFTSKAIYPRFSPTLGTLILPAKYRPQNGLVEKTFSLSITGGWRFIFSKTDPNHAVGITIGVGPSTVPLNADNTDATVSGITEQTDRGAITFSLNLVYQWQRLQIGLSTGKDFLLDGNKEKWKYQGMNWLSLGIGVNIFSEDKPSDKTKGN